MIRDNPVDDGQAEAAAAGDRSPPAEELARHAGQFIRQESRCRDR